VAEKTWPRTSGTPQEATRPVSHCTVANILQIPSRKVPEIHGHVSSVTTIKENTYYDSDHLSDIYLNKKKEEISCLR
jgi:hypothetical protein